MKHTLSIALVCLLVASGAFGQCTKTATGRVVCGDGKNAATANPRTGTAATPQTNSNGVKNTQTSQGGQAKTKNGKGVVHTPSGKTCVKTASGQGCN